MTVKTDGSKSGDFSLKVISQTLEFICYHLQKHEGSFPLLIHMTAMDDYFSTDHRDQASLHPCPSVVLCHTSRCEHMACSSQRGISKHGMSRSLKNIGTIIFTSLLLLLESSYHARKHGLAW